MAGAPQVLRFSTNVNAMRPGQDVIFSAVVTDPQGIDDLIGGQLESESGASYGTFSTSAAEGAYSLRLTWDEIHRGQPLDFPDEQRRSFIGRFFDQGGLEATARVELRFHCDGTPVCDGRCAADGDVECHCTALGEGPHCLDDRVVVCGAPGEESGVALDCPAADATCFLRPGDGNPTCLVPEGSPCLIETGEDTIIVLPCGRNGVIDRNMGCSLTSNTEGVCRSGVPGCAASSNDQVCANVTFVALQCIDFGGGHGQRIVVDCVGLAGASSCSDDVCVQSDQGGTCDDGLVVCGADLTCEGAVAGSSPGSCEPGGG